MPGFGTSTTTMALTPTPTPTPLLASRLYDHSVREARDAHGGEEMREKRRGRLGSGWLAVDEALEGGVDAGVGGVVGITGVEIGRARELAHAFLISHLLASSAATAVVVDTSGSLDVLRLHGGIVARLRRRRQSLGHGLTTTTAVDPDQDQDIEAEALAALDRVAIMRVFDFAGVVEAVEEMREGLERRELVHAGEGREGGDEIKMKKTQPLGEGTELPPMPAPEEIARRSGTGLKRVPTTIADSEDEEDEDEEMLLLDEEPLPEAAAAAATSLPTAAKTGHHHDNDDEQQRQQHRQAGDKLPPQPSHETTTPNSSPGFLLIDNLAHLSTPLLKANYVQTSADLTCLLRTLTALTRAHELRTFLVNGIQQHQHQYQHPGAAVSLSTPLLQHVLPGFLDLDIEVAVCGRDRAAREQAGAGRRGHGHVDVVVEVVGDRFGARVGRWGVWDWDLEENGDG